MFSGLYRGQEVAIKILKDKITDKQILDDWAAEFNIMSMVREDKREREEKEERRTLSAKMVYTDEERRSEKMRG